jgi:hypothetical protein
MLNYVFVNKKGILNGVQLNGRVLGDWQMCLTRNFIPNYQAKLQSYASQNDLAARYKVQEHLLTPEKLRF